MTREELIHELKQIATIKKITTEKIADWMEMDRKATVRMFQLLDKLNLEGLTDDK